MKRFLSSDCLSYFQSNQLLSEGQVTMIVVFHQSKNINNEIFWYEQYIDLFIETLFIDIEKRIVYYPMSVQMIIISYNRIALLLQSFHQNITRSDVWSNISKLCIFFFCAYIINYFCFKICFSVTLWLKCFHDWRNKSIVWHIALIFSHTMNKNQHC